MKKLEAFKITSEGLSEITVNGDDLLKELYREVECSLVDVVSVKGYDIWLDDEGKLVDKDPSVLFLKDGQVVDYVAGNCVILKQENGEAKALTDVTKEVFKSHLEYYATNYKGKVIKVLGIAL